MVADAGLLITDGTRRVPRVEVVAELIRQWHPDVLVCDRFRFPELLDCGLSCPIVPRVARWSEQTADIRALRRLAADGPLSCAIASRGLVAGSLAVADVRHDESGNLKLVKRGTHNQARDDCAAALVLAAGAVSRMPKRSSAGVYLGTA